MQTILGPFHPYLEDALAAELAKYKQNDALTPLLILVPSDALKKRIKIFLASERDLSLLNVPILTFHQLALRLFAESRGDNPSMVRDDLFLEEVVRQILRARHSGAEAFAGIEDKTGGSAALWQTLRDLRDAKLAPEVALEALRENRFSGKTSGRTGDLIRLHESLRKFCRSKRIRDATDIVELASEQAASSSFLAQFAQIFYYGFYDLTQVQVDFFHAVARNFPTTLFFPLVKTNPQHDGWLFADRFYQRYVQGLASGSTSALGDGGTASLPATFRLFDEVAERVYAAPPENWRLTIANGFGTEDEVSTVAKEILSLTGDGAMGFHEIGVVARALEDYGAAIMKIFRAHHIPLRGAVEEPLTLFPLTKAAIMLLDLPAKDFLRSQVIDLLSSPYFRVDIGDLVNFSPRPDLWDLATRELAICKGISEWRRLRNYQTRGLTFSKLGGDEDARRIHIGADQVTVLANITDALIADLSGLPARATWSDYARICRGLLEKYLGIHPEKQNQEPNVEERVQSEILEVLDQIAGLDALGDEVSLAGFSETFQRWLERSSVAAQPNDVHGVTVLSATAARGLPFRALFVLGMNEGVFPRTIREDAFLRDRDREILERDLGYKINPKLAAFDEEKLLFTLLVGAARERLYISFQRADASGRALAPSWYLGELKRALGSDSEKLLSEITVPRGVVEKSRVEPHSHEELLLPEELAVRMSIAGRDPTPLVQAFDLATKLYQKGREAVTLLDRSKNRLHRLDGMVGPLAEYWQRLSARGLSPTALETYARCPFQFFARHVLRLERLELPEESLGPGFGEYGELGHEILKRCYQQLSGSGYFQDASRSADVPSIVQDIAQGIFFEYEQKRPVGYPLSWENLKDSLTQVIQQVVAADLAEIKDSGFIPVDFEIESKTRIPPQWPKPLAGMEIHGRMDRIDRHPKLNRLRVIDYKFKFSAHSTTQDTNLDRSALRGQKLQPPFYCVLGKQSAVDGTAEAPADVEAKFYYIAHRWRDGPLVPAGFGADGFSGKLGAEVRRTVAYLAGAIHEGRFFIQRGDYCSHCDVAEICRKNHPPSLWRAENDPMTATHRGLRDKDTRNL